MIDSPSGVEVQTYISPPQHPSYEDLAAVVRDDRSQVRRDARLLTSACFSLAMAFFFLSFVTATFNHPQATFALYGCGLTAAGAGMFALARALLK